MDNQADGLRRIGACAYESIAEMVAALHRDATADDCEETARDRIEEDALSVRVFGERTAGGWTADRYELLLTTGGPAVRIVGDLCDGEPHSARLEVQDWFQPWTEYHDADPAILLEYAACFYFGE
jgi:hypothetical protein